MKCLPCLVKLHIRLTVAYFLFRVHILATLSVLIGEAWIMDATLLTTLFTPNIDVIG